MRILIAEDDAVSRRVLEGMLQRWGHELVIACDGKEAWDTLNRDDAPGLAILDWMMPFLDGLRVCEKVRQANRSTYVILLTAKGSKQDIITGLQAGADDYVIKPFDREELRARVNVGVRIVELQRHLDDRIDELQKALSQIRRLHGIMPICAHCKRIRNDENYWQQVEAYISAHSDARFSHSICPDCFERVKMDLDALESR